MSARAPMPSAPPTRRRDPWLPLRIVHAVVVYLFGFAAMMLGALASALAIPLLSYARRHRHLMRPAIGVPLWLTGSRIRVVRDPRFDPERRAVFCQNHQSALDGALSGVVLPHPFCGTFNHWHSFVPGYGWLMTLSHGIRVYPGSERLTRLVAQARDRVARNLSILVFPEGHRTISGSVGPFRSGTFFLARDVGLPIVPVCVRGLDAVLPKGGRLVRRGDIAVYLGAPIETRGLSDDEVRALVERVRAIHVAFIERGETPRSEPVATGLTAIVLAAGRGRRMGGPKLLAERDGRPFGRLILDRLAAAGIDDVVLVIAESEAEAARALAPRTTLAINPTPERGMLSSLAVGVAARPARSGYLVVLVDHPDVEVASYRALAEAHVASPHAVIKPSYQGDGGHPLVIPRALAETLDGTDHPGGLSSLVQHSELEVRRVALDDPGLGRNLNTPEELARTLR